MGIDIGPTAIGRSADRTRLAGLVRDVANGQGATLWLRGESGIGKSTLVGTMVAAAPALGCAVLRASARVATQTCALRLISECLQLSNKSMDATSEDMARLLSGELAAPVAIDPVLAVSERMLELVDRLCSARPTIIVLEDLQWADESSLLVWNRMARLVDQIPLLLVGTCRPVPYRATVARLGDLVVRRGGVAVELGPMDVNEVGQLAARMVGTVAGPVFAAELARAGGNPRYVGELVDAALSTGLLDVIDGVAEPREPLTALPESLTSVIERDFAALSENTRRALGPAAVLGAEFDAEELALVTARSMAEVSEAIDEAAAAGIVAGTRNRLTFRQEVVRDWLVERMPVPMRRGLHRHVARVLADAGRGVEVVAPHLLALPDVIDGWARTWLVDTSESMLSAVPQDSVPLLTRAVSGLGEGDPLWEPLMARLAVVLFRLGRDEQAGTVAEAMLHGAADIGLAARVRILAARSAATKGQFGEALATLAESVDAARFPLTLRARMRAWEAMLLTCLGRAEEAQARARQALVDAQQCGDSAALALVWPVLAPIAPDGSWKIAPIDRTLSALADTAESTGLRMILLRNRLGRLAPAGSGELDRALRQALPSVRPADAHKAATVRATVAEICFHTGGWDESLQHAVSIDPHLVDSPSMTCLHALVALIALHRDDADLAGRHLRAAGLIGSADAAPPLPFGTCVTDAMATHAEISGDLHGALALRRTWLDLRSGPLQVARVDEAPQLMRLALATGDIVTATATAAACLEHLDAPDGWALAARCGLAMMNNDTAALLAIAEGYRAHRWPLRMGFALEEAAVRLAQRSDTGGARAALAGAVRVYSQLGAAWDIRRARARLRPTGVRPPSGVAHRRVQTGWDALTPAEARIADLVAQGLSNPDIAAALFLSRNTVQTHVSRILAKLQVRSRMQVVRGS